MNKSEIKCTKELPFFNPYYTQTSFKKVCTVLGGLKSSETNDLLKILQEKDPPHSNPHQYDPLIMFEVIRTNPICNGICQKSGYKYWEQLVERCYDLEKAAFEIGGRNTRIHQDD